MTMSVAVIGAGAAGLACAALLAEHGCGVEVFEASPRIGGRVRSWPARIPTAPAAGSPVWELGAQMVHAPGLDLLGRRYGLEVVPAPRSEFAFLVDGTTLPVWRADRRGIRPWELAGRLPPAGSGSVADWLLAAVPAGAPNRVARAWFEQEWACAAEVLSLPAAAAWVADRSRPTAVKAAESVVPAGLSALIRRLARGVVVHCSAPVRRVCVTGSRPWIEVHDSRVEVDAVVLTVPPWTLGHAGGAGLLLTGVPAARVNAARSLTAGDAVVAVVTWSHAGPSDRTVFDVDGHGFLRSRAGTAQIQVVSKGPSAAVARACIADPEALIRLLRQAFDWTDGGRPTDIVVADWGRDRFIGGAFSAPTPGHLTARHALRGLSGSGLHLAGEATRLDGSAGRLHGAVQSGIEAAAHVLDAVSARPRPVAALTPGGAL